MSVDTASYADLLVMIAALKEENERLTSEGLEVVVQLVECKARVAELEHTLKTLVEHNT